MLNWSLSLMTFLMSLPTVLRRTIDLNNLGELYNFLFGLGITTVVDILKCDGQYPKLIQTLAIWIIVLRYSSSLRIVLRWLHNNLSGPGAEELLQLDIAVLNFSFENTGQGMVGLLVISLRIFISTWWLLAVLKVEWRAYHKSLMSEHLWLLYLIVLITGNFLLLTQFITSQKPHLLLTISWILLSKKVCFVNLTLFLKLFHFSRFLVALYLFILIYFLISIFIFILFFILNLDKEYTGYTGHKA